MNYGEINEKRKKDTIVKRNNETKYWRLKHYFMPLHLNLEPLISYSGV